MERLADKWLIYNRKKTGTLARVKLLPEDGLFYLGGKAFKAAQLLRLCVCRALCQQAVCFHVPQHPAAVLQRRLYPGILRFQPGILLFEQFVQLLLLLQQ